MAEVGGGVFDPATNIRLMGYLLQQLAENDRRRLEAAQGPTATRAPASSELSQESADAAQTDVLAAGSHVPGRAEAPPPS
eukprot:11987831-Heterocapsa_arctica.AAC.1